MVPLLICPPGRCILSPFVKVYVLGSFRHSIVTFSLACVTTAYTYLHISLISFLPNVSAKSKCPQASLHAPPCTQQLHAPLVSSPKSEHLSWNQSSPLFSPSLVLPPLIGRAYRTLALLILFGSSKAWPRGNRVSPQGDYGY